MVAGATMAVIPVIIMRVPITRIIADASASQAIIAIAAEAEVAARAAAEAGESATSTDRERIIPPRKFYRMRRRASAALASP